MMAVDTDQMFDEVETLQVSLNFTSDVGFPYLKDKLAEVLWKSERASDLLIKVVRLTERATREWQEQKALYVVTGAPSHKEAASQAQAVLSRLGYVQKVVEVRRTHLRALPQDIRLYARVMEDMLEAGRHPSPELPPSTFKAAVTAVDPDDALKALFE